MKLVIHLSFFEMCLSNCNCWNVSKRLNIQSKEIFTYVMKYLFESNSKDIGRMFMTLFLCPYGWLWANNCSLGRLCGAAIVNFGITANGSVVWVTCFYMLRGRLRLSKSIINTYARYGKILSNIYDGAFFRKKLTAFSR